MTLSERQHPLLEMFAGHSVMSAKHAQAINQTTFASFIRRDYIRYSTVRRGFQITDKGREAWRRFNETSIQRKDPTGPLTKYFDAMSYGVNLNEPKPRLVKGARRRHSVAA